MRLLLLCALLSGCALGPPSAEPPAPTPAAAKPGYALVYLARPARVYASEVYPDVTVNGRDAAALRNGSYTYFYLRPGVYDIAADKAQWYSSGWGDGVRQFVDAGRVYVLRLVADDDGGWGWRVDVDPPGLGALRGLRFVAPGAAFADS